MRSRRRVSRFVLCLAGTVLLVCGGAGQAAADHFSAQSANGSNDFTAAVLAPPTSLTVDQACVPDPIPARRSANGSTFASGNNSGTLTIARPSGAQVGDVMIASIDWVGAATITPSSPGLWTAVFNPQVKDGSVAQSVYYRVVTASEPAAYSWTGSTDAAAGGIVAYSGVDPVAPVHATSAYSGSGRTAPSLTTTRANVRLVGLWAVPGVQTSTVPNGMTQIWNGASSGVGGGAAQVQSVGADEPWPTPGATGTRTLDGTGGRSVSQLVALQPPSRPHATTTWALSADAYATGQTYRRGSAGTVQRQEGLPASTTSQTDGPLSSGTAYTVDVTSTYANWSSTAATASFTAITCP